jgi:hypothetical protein
VAFAGTRSGASSPLTAYVPDMSNLSGIALDQAWLRFPAPAIGANAI